MSMGFEVRGNDGKLTASSSSPIYTCIFSQVLPNNASFTVVGASSSDVMALTKLSGAGGASPWIGAAESNLGTRGVHRLCIFRPISQADITEEPFGISVFTPDGKISFSSSSYPLVFSNTPVYPALLYGGTRLYSVRTGVNFSSYSDLSWVDMSGSVSSETILIRTYDGYYPVTYGLLNRNFVIVDVNDIPLNYSTGDVSLNIR